jgi:PAS domain S-box-containing protein
MNNPLPSHPPSARVTPAQVTLFLSILIAAIVLAALGFDLLDKRQRVLDNARQEAQNIAGTQARLIRDHLGHVDGVLAQLAVRWHARQLLHEDAEQSLRDLLRNHRNLLPDAIELLLADDKGRVVAAANTLLGDLPLETYCPALASQRQNGVRQGLVAYHPELAAQCPASPGLIYLKPLKRSDYTLWLFLLPDGFRDNLDAELPRFSASARFRIVGGSGNLLLAGGAPPGQASDGVATVSATVTVPGRDVSVGVDYAPEHILAQLWRPQAGFTFALALGLLLSWSLIAFFILRTVRQYQDYLAASEQHFRTLADSGSALIWTAGGDKLCNYFNQPWLRFTGRSLAQELGNGWAEGVHPDDLARCLDIYVGHFDKRQAFSMDYRLRHADGGYRWIRDDGVPRHDRDGLFIGYIGFCYDITAQQEAAQALQAAQSASLEAQRQGRLAALNQMEDANAARRLAEAATAEQQLLNQRITNLLEDMRQSEARYRHLFEHNPAPMLVYERGSLRLLAVNEAFCRHYGYSHEEALDLRLTDLYPERDRQRIADLITRLAGYANVGEWQHLKKDGSEITIEARSHDIEYQGCRARMAVITDITDRKAVERAVRESEERFRNLAENSADWIWALDLNGHHTYSNPNIGALLGFAVDEFLALAPASLVHPDDLAKFGATFEHARASRTGWRNVVIRWRHKDGGYRLLESSAAPVMDDQGELQGFQGVDRDITERVQLEQERARLASILEATSDIVSMADPQGNIIYFNGPGRTLLGIESNSTMPDVIPKVHPQWAADLVLGEGVPTAIRTGSWSGETAVLGAGGEEIPVSQVILSHKDTQGNLLFLSTIMRDIRESRAAAQALRESEERLRLALTAAQQGLYDLDLTTGDAKVSPEYATMLGYDPATFKETNAAWRERLHPDDQAAVYKAYEDYVADRIPEYRVEFRQRTRDGGWKWVLSMGRIQDWSADGRPLRMLGTHTDIDALKAAEAALRDLNVSLEARVAQRTVELTAANQELESFAYAISHDLRAPLRAMSGFSVALQEDYGDTLTGDAKRYLDQIDLASRKMSDLVDGLLTLSRSTRGELRHDPVDLSVLARRRLDRLAHGEPLRHVTIEVETDLHALGDVRMLEVVIDNLVDNAWKYTGRTAAPCIRVHAGTVNGLRGFCVSDNGAGFDMAHAARLFQPFQRLHRQEEFPGTGIGLATVQRIVHRHGGEIVAQGKPDEGACFCFTLSASGLEKPS